jgi:hypothetical protein
VVVVEFAGKVKVPVEEVVAEVVVSEIEVEVESEAVVEADKLAVSVVED